MPIASRTVGASRAAALTLCGVLVALASSCGSDAAPAGSLFVRQPDAVLEEQGRLAVTRGSGWEGGDAGVWHDRTTAVNGVELCWSKGRRAHLDLHSLGPQAHTLRLLAAAPEGGAMEVELALGDVELGTFPLTAEPTWIEVPTPSSAWREGGNVLRLEVERTAQLPRHDAVGVGVAEVVWAEPRRVVIDDTSLQFEPGTGVVYQLSGTAGRELLIGGHTPGDGALMLSLGAFDPVDSSVVAVREPLTVLPNIDGRIEWRARLDELAPVFATGTGSLRIQWVGDAPVTIDNLAFVDPPSAPSRPSVVFVSVDTLAARHLSCYGYPRRTSPNIDRLASESIVFEACMANAPWTAPSYLSQFTGLYPIAHEVSTAGVVDPQGWESNHLAANRWTWAESMRSAGYTTAAWIDNPWVSPGMGMDQGFDLFDMSASEIYLSDTSGGFAHILSPAMKWMGAQRGPFFALLQPMDPHGPYFTKWRYRDRWDGDGLYDSERRIPVGYEQLHAWGVVPEYVAWGERKGLGRPPPKVRTEPYQNAYDEKIAEVDDYFGRLMAFLERTGILDRSIVVFSSDHGEAMGQHDYWFDHGILYDEVLRVPLIVRLPGGEHGGRRVSTPVQLVDLMPTVLELTGLPVPEHLHGRSLVPAIRGETLPDVPIYAHGGIAEQTAILHEGFKLVTTRPATGSYQTILTTPRLSREHVATTAPELAGTFWRNAEYTEWVRANPKTWERVIAPIRGKFDELYDTTADPLEMVDLLGDEAPLAERVRELTAALAAERARGLAAQATASRSARPMVLSDAVRRQLEALGYLPSDSGAATSDQ